MSYEAIVCKIDEIKPIPGADFIVLASVLNYRVIVSKDAQVGDLGVFFNPEGKLSDTYLYENNLYSNPQLNKDPEKKGYFGNNGKITIKKLKRVISEGFWMPMESFAWCGLNNLKEGDTFTYINGHLICEKFFSKATLDAINSQKTKTKTLWNRWKFLPLKEKIKRFFPYLWITIITKVKGSEKENFRLLKEHYDTKQLRQNIRRIPVGALVYISEKCHGTSQRTGKILTKKIHTGLFGWFKNLFSKQSYKIVSGSRRVILNLDKIKSNKPFIDGYYSDTEFREYFHNKFKELPIKKGECFYYEIVGYTAKHSDSTIMGKYPIEDEELKKLYGDTIIFTYGCNKDINPYRMLVYRITMTNEDGQEVEYSWPQVEARCIELGFETVPVLTKFLYTGDQKDLVSTCRCLCNGKDILDNRHPREGVILRIEDKELFDAYKFKGDIFTMLEGIRSNSDDLIDYEDIS